MNSKHHNFLCSKSPSSSVPTMQTLAFTQVKGFTLVELMISLVLGRVIN